MKKILILASLALLAACNSNEPAKSDTTKSAPDSTTAVRDITSPYEIGYSSKFAIDDPKNAETLLTLFKDWDNGNLSAHKEMFADSLEFHFSDGSMMHSTRDSVLAMGQAFRNTLATSIATIDAITAVKSTDKNESWVLIWAKENNTDKKGKKDSSYIQETWRFNKNGQADKFFQFRAAAASPKK